VANAQRKPLDQPDEARPIDKGRVDVVNFDAGTVLRTTFEPGWRWSESVKPVVGGDSCQVHHFGYAVSGRLHVVMDDGEELEFSAGDAVNIPPGHDGWVVGDEPYVGIDVMGTEFAKPS
jgi:mannose-6-phosphate isomerase-like protein (cupin superfamily)